MQLLHIIIYDVYNACTSGVAAIRCGENCGPTNNNNSHLYYCVEIRNLKYKCVPEDRARCRSTL